MLKRMILINSANFQFADIDLSKEIFFVGDNASGKTTTTRALHFLYNGDGQKLAIPRSKDSFSKHYFPHDDSYIIYVFETFFIFTYKRNDTIRRWFSKQEFDIQRVVKNKELLEFKDIETYIKSASLKYKPQTIDEYTSTLYGNNKRYLDFSIAKIENYKIFLDLFNMIFNIDKAIVTASDIKKAIQKSLDRKDETLSIDYEDFIRKLNGFSRSYHFFKTFDNSRVHLKNALSTKDELLTLEHSTRVKHKAINYRYHFETNEFNKQKSHIDQISSEIKKYKNRVKSIEKFHEKFEIRLSDKVELSYREITKLEVLREKFDPLAVEENTLMANRHDGIKKELNEKRYSLQKLKDQQTSVQKEVEAEIDQIKYKIKITIPNETRQNIYQLSELEKSNYENEILEIKKEYEESENKLKDKIKSIEDQIESLKSELNSIDIVILTKQSEIKKEQTNKIQLHELEKSNLTDQIDDINKKIRKLQEDKYELNFKYQEHENRYESLRKSNAKVLSSKRVLLNNKILNARAIINPIKNSFNEFLSNEIDGWEKVIYPIIDKDLLKKSCDELNPEVIDSKAPLGFKIDSSNLEKIPTKDEAQEIIRKNRLEKYELLKNSKDVYRAEVAKLDEEKNELLSIIESCEKEINNSIDSRSSLNAKKEKVTNEIDQLLEDLKDKLEKINKKYTQKRDVINQKITTFKTQVKSFESDIKELHKSQRSENDKSVQRRDFNLEIIKSQEIKKAKQIIKEEESKITTLLDSIKSIDEDDMIFKLDREVKTLDNNLKDAYNAITFLKEYEDSKDKILQLPTKESLLNRQLKLKQNRKSLIKKIEKITNEKISQLTNTKIELENRLNRYNKGINKVHALNIEIGEEKIETEELMIDLVESLEDSTREYRNKKSKFRELIDKLKKLELHSLIELNFNMDSFGEVKSISEIENIIDSLNELENFEKNKYESEKRRSHNNFDSFLKNTIPSKLQSFEDLESEFEKAQASINKSLSQADFGVIREIKLITDSSKNRNDSIATLLKELSRRVDDTISLYSNKSLFYHDVSKSVGNIEDIQTILQEIKKRGSNGPINLFDTINLSISYIENGKKIENKLNIKDESSSGGNILLKVAIAMSILTRYARKTTNETPFFLIIDEISKLQSKNQDLIRSYINDNGFKTLFITPDPAYPDPDRALYYTFKNIQEEWETLEIRQMNII